MMVFFTVAKEGVRTRWGEFIRELVDIEDGGVLKETWKREERSLVLQSEFKDSIMEMKRRKATRVDKISVEVITGWTA